MTDAQAGGFSFLSHHRTGLIALPGVAAAGSVAATATLSDGSVTPAQTFTLAGPAEIAGIDPTQIARQYPLPGATDAETEFFPLVEFSAPQLPWLVPTPNGPHAPYPWCCLVAVEARDGVTVNPGGTGLPDVLQIDAPAQVSEELPDPADAGLWAHAFAATIVTTATGTDPVQSGAAPPPTGSRLIAPRRLTPQSSYIACLVPTLKATALAGLGRPDSEIAAVLAAAQPNYAWATTDATVRLPVYLSWEFACGAGGDFESLARALKEVPLDPTFGTRELDLGLAGGAMPVTTTSAVRLRGALTAPGVAAEAAWPDASDADQVKADAALVAEIATAARLTAAAAAAGPAGRPVVGPLLYARAAAGRTNVGATSPAADWFDQLNRDPRARAAAGFGSRVLRRNVESVMARAWDQVGAIDQANTALRRLQVSRTVARSLHSRHLSALSPGRLLAVARPVLGRVGLPAAATGGTAAADALAAVAASALPGGATWRGITAALRPGSGSGDAAAVAGQDAPGRILSGLLPGLAEPDFVPDGTVSLAAPSAVFGANAPALLVDAVRTAATAAGIAVPAAGSPTAQLVAGLDDLTSQAGRQADSAATSLASETGAVVRQRAIPAAGATFTQRFGGLLPDKALAAASPLRTAFAIPISKGGVGESGGVGGKGGIGATGGHGGISTTGGSIGLANPVVVSLGGTDLRLATMREAFASAVDRFIRAGMAVAPPSATPFDLNAARTGLLASLDPATNIAALAAARLPGLATLRGAGSGGSGAAGGTAAPDPIAPVMAGPVFGDPAYTDLAAASKDAFVPGLDTVPDDSVTVMQTDPRFIAAYLAGLNSALGHELMWRGFPTDERGTYWYSFWGAGPDIGPLHRFSGALAANVDAGAQPQLVLVLRGRLLRRYPDADIYAVLASGTAGLPELDGGAAITRPLFRDAIGPDVTLVGFPLTYAEVVGTGGGVGYWFVIAEHPGQPRFGLTDPDPAEPHPPLPSWNELSWADLGAASAAATYVPSAAPPMSPAGTTHQWAGSAAEMAAITYQPPVRVAIRATDLLQASAAAPTPMPTPLTPTPTPPAPPTPTSP